MFNWIYYSSRTMVIAHAPEFIVLMLFFVSILIVNIIRRVRLEKDFQKSEIFNHTLIKYLPHKIFLKDLNSRYLACNDNYAKDLGISADDIIGKDDFAFYPPELAEKYRVDDRDVMINGHVKDIEEPYIVNYKKFWSHTIKIPFRNAQNEIKGVLGIFEDISAKKQSEEDLRNERAFLDILLTLASGLINVPLCDIDVAITEMLARLGRFTGMDRTYVCRHDLLRRVNSNTHEWCAEGIPSEKDNLQEIPFDICMDIIEVLQRGEIYTLSDISMLPADYPMRQLVEQQGIKSLIIIPMMFDGVNTGFVGFDSVNEVRAFSEREIKLLKVFAEIISSVLERQKKELELKKHKEKLEDIVIERTKNLIKTNEKLNIEIAEHKKTEVDLNNAIEQIKTLRGILPICSCCKKIRDDTGYWQQVEVYVRDHTEVEFSHSLCPECVKKLYPDLKSNKNNGV